MMIPSLTPSVGIETISDYAIMHKKGVGMSAIKDEAYKMITNLPENCTYEDIQYHLYVIEKIQKGKERAATGETLSHAKAKERMSKWLSR